jgi:hemolysin activation/secretion protein
LHSKLFGLALLALSAGVAARQTPVAGNQLQQIPPTPQAPKAAPEMRVDPRLATAPAASEADGERITVAGLAITGQRAFPEALLVEVAGVQRGSALNLAQLRAAAARIVDYYHSQGYFLARAYLPAQDVKGGVVTIAVVEGQYGKVSLRNQSRLKDNVALALLDGLEQGDAVLMAPLETRLLLLSDLPGVIVKSTLLPGAAVGTTDLIVDLAPGARVNGSIDADNHGNRYTGRTRIGGTVNVNQLAGQGDVMTLRAMTSARGLNYARLSYQLQAGRISAGAAYARMDYELGEDFKALDAHGTAGIASVFASYPLARARAGSLYARVNLDAKKLRDRQDASGVALDKKATVLAVSINGDLHDAGGSNRFTLTWSSGDLDIGNAAALATDAITARTNGRYHKLGYSVSRLQTLAPGLALYGAVNGQFSSKNLDASEKTSLGGSGGVRGYPEGEANADSANIFSVELKKAMPGQLELLAFADHGEATLDKDAWSAGRNHRSLSAAGVGLEWNGYRGLTAKAYVARKLGNEKAVSAPDARTRFWIEAVKYF